MPSVIKGKGKIYENDEYLADVDYRLEEVETPSGIKDIWGEIFGDENLIFDIFNRGMATLLLSEGRKLDFTVTSGIAGSDRCTIEALGPFRE